MKEYLICIDSDGCAIDSMEIKHRKCFGPCLIEIWHLEAWETEILKRWNEINLYSMTRGINRFLGLEKILIEINEKYKKIEGLEQYIKWCHTTKTFSNTAVVSEINGGNHFIFSKVFEWSCDVNRKIEEISSDILPFSGVGNVLKMMQEFADITIVSSANPKAVFDEWNRFGFMQYVDRVMAQDEGTKSECIHKMKEKGYKENRIIVLGDAPGDEQAAVENGVFFYPILAGYENESWDELKKEGLLRIISEKNVKEYQEELLNKFHKNLGID